MVLQVCRPEAVQGHQDEGGPGETGWGRQGRNRVLFFVFFIAILLFAVKIKSKWEKGEDEKSYS